MSGLSEHVIYCVGLPLTLGAGQAASVAVGSYAVPGARVLVFDPSVSETCATRAIHLLNTTGRVLAPGSVSVSEAGRLVSQSVFTPMLPGDEQLIPYGEDSTVSVTRSVARDACTSALELEYDRRPGGKRVLTGVRLNDTINRRTTYTLKNNATAAPSTSGTNRSTGGSSDAPTADAATSVPLYIDHAASSADGGYAIVSEERSIKMTPAQNFSRYAFALAPREELLFSVDERAVTTRRASRPSEVKRLLESEQFRDGAGGDVLDSPTRAALVAMMARADRDELLDTVEREIGGDASHIGAHVTAKELLAWRSAGSLPASMLGSLDTLHALKAQRAEGQRKIGLAQAHVAEIFVNQDRLRENIRSLEKVGPNVLMKRYLSDLDKEEDDLIGTRKAIATIEEQGAKILAEMAALKLAVGAEVKALRSQQSAEEGEPL